MDPSLIIAGAGGIANLIGGAANRRSVDKQNNRSEMYNTLMYNRQRQDALSDWNMQNAYNDPSAQMQRLKNAGLNPNLVYGNGADAQSQSAPRSSSVGQPQFRTKDYNFGSVAQQALMMQQAQANIARTQAETDAIKSRTTGSEFQNNVNKAIGADAIARKFDLELKSMDNRTHKEIVEFGAYLKAGFGEVSVTPDLIKASSPRVKAIKAEFDRAVEEAENAKSRGDELDATVAIRRFEAKLTKMGISPNSPWFLKSMLSLLEKLNIKF